MDKTLIFFRNIPLKSGNDFGKQHPTSVRISCITHDGCMKINPNTVEEGSATGMKLILMIFGMSSSEKMKIGNTTLMIPGEVKHNTSGKIDKATKNLS